MKDIPKQDRSKVRNAPSLEQKYNFDGRFKANEVKIISVEKKTSKNSQEFQALSNQMPALNQFKTNAETDISDLKSFKSTTQGQINSLNSFKNSVETDISDLKSFKSSAETQISNISGEIKEYSITWIKTVAPTLSNAPASSWNTTNLKNEHIGDLYLNTSTGLLYVFRKSGTNYGWQKVNATVSYSDIQNKPYLITFINDVGCVMATYQIAPGTRVVPPVENKSWINDDTGETVSFPFTPTGNTTLIC